MSPHRTEAPQRIPSPDFARRAAITAVAITAVGLLLTTSHGLTALLAATLFVGGYEYRSLTAPGGRRGERIASGLATVLAGAAAPFAALAHVAGGPLVLAILALTIAIVAFVPRRVVARDARPGLLVTIAGPIYFGILLSFLFLLQEPGGAHRHYWVWLALAVAWGGDIGGYVVGRLWGHHPLAPTVSPRKTVEGAIGSLVLGSLAAWAVWNTDRAALPLATLAWLAPSAQVLSQAGDLLESRVKRLSGAKDSGRILLEQGGLLDSIDGLCLAAPGIYFAAGLAWR